MGVARWRDAVDSRRTHPGGIWLVLAQQYSPDCVTADDLLSRRHRAKVIPFPLPSAAKMVRW